MFDLKLKEIGGAEVAQRFKNASDGLRPRLQEEMDAIGRDIVRAAQETVPVDSGRTRSRIVFLGREGKHGKAATKRGSLLLTVLPGEPTAHLIERGVDAMVRVRRNKKEDKYETVIKKQTRTRTHVRFVQTRMGITFVKPYRLHIKARPYFEPAVESVGGAEGVNARLQNTINRLASEGR